MNRLRLLVVLVVFVVLAIGAYDGLSPRLTRTSLTGTAASAASAAEAAYFQTGDPDAASLAARSVVVDAGAELAAFKITPGGGTSVTVVMRARSIILGHLGIKSLSDRSQVEVTVGAPPKVGPIPTTSTTHLR